MFLIFGIDTTIYRASFRYVQFINININDTQLNQITLPVYVGGLGVLAPIAFLASAAAMLSCQEAILPDQIRGADDQAESLALSTWNTITSEGKPSDARKVQGRNDTSCLTI